MCKFCNVIENRTARKKYYEDATFIMFDCKDCYTPILISKKHQKQIDEADMSMAYHLFYKHAERIDMTKWYVDHQRSPEDHWHCHLRRL